MARPKLDPNARKLNVQVAPPAELEPKKLALWHREFARFPAGYFTPSDVRGMLLYLDAVAFYEQACTVADVLAEFPDKAAAAAAARKERRDSLTQVHRLQRDLRMYPATRTHREIHGSMANNPTGQSAQPGDEAGWRGLFPVNKGGK